MKCRNCNDRITKGKWIWYHVTSSFREPQYCNIFRDTVAEPQPEFKDYLKEVENEK